MNLLKIVRDDVFAQRQLLEAYERALLKLPEGRLCYKVVNRKVRYYVWDPKKKRQVYIKKKDINLVYQLKYRRVLEEAIKTILTNLTIQEKFLQKYQDYDPLSCQLRLGKVYQDIPEKFFLMPRKVILAEGYKSSYRSEDLIQTSSFGMKFRSKSETLIAELLHASNIPFEYEKTLILEDEYGEKQYYKPDFTIILPDGRRIFWEHFGRMDLPAYRQKNFKRLAVYHYNDIYPPKNLIITMDSKSGGIDIDAIQNIITNQLLPLFQGKQT